jgi:hypothetical protein
VNQEDPLRKREDFAISLRKKKKNEILRQKRSRLTNAIVKAGSVNVHASSNPTNSSQVSNKQDGVYRGCPLLSFDGVFGQTNDQLDASYQPISLRTILEKRARDLIDDERHYKPLKKDESTDFLVS